MEFYSVIKKNNNKILPLATTWMYLEVIMVSEMARNYVRNIYIIYKYNYIYNYQ